MGASPAQPAGVEHLIVHPSAPSSVLVSPGQVFTTYYGEDAEGVTCIQGSYYAV